MPGRLRRVIHRIKSGIKNRLFSRRIGSAGEKKEMQSPDDSAPDEKSKMLGAEANRIEEVEEIKGKKRKRTLEPEYP